MQWIIASLVAVVGAIVSVVVSRRNSPKRDLTRQEEDSVGNTDKEMVESEFPPSRPEGILTPHDLWIGDLEKVRDFVIREWDPPMDHEDMPSTRAELRPVYGRAPKEEGNKQYPKADMGIFTFPGSWNGGRARLYMHSLFEPYLRMWLKLLTIFGILEYVKQLGCYNHRHIRHNKANPLSNHSWGVACDCNTSKKYTDKPGQNRAIYRHLSWQRKLGGKHVVCKMSDQRSRKGPVPMPFTKDWLVVYDGGMPFEAVLSLKMIGLTWGGDWGRDLWVGQVLKHGIGYDPKLLQGKDLEDYKNSLSEWKKVSFVDPMHFEAQRRRGHFIKRWMQLGGERD